MIDESGAGRGDAPAPATVETPRAADTTTVLTNEAVNAVQGVDGSGAGNPRSERAQPPETGGSEGHNWMGRKGRENAAALAEHFARIAEKDGALAEAERQGLLMLRGGGEVVKWSGLIVGGAVYFPLRFGVYGPLRSLAGAVGTAALAIPAGIESAIAHVRFGGQQLTDLFDHGVQTAAADRAAILEATNGGSGQEQSADAPQTPAKILREVTPDAIALLDRVRENDSLRLGWGKCRQALRASARLARHPLTAVSGARQNPSRFATAVAGSR